MSLYICILKCPSKTKNNKNVTNFNDYFKEKKNNKTSYSYKYNFIFKSKIQKIKYIPKHIAM